MFVYAGIKCIINIYEYPSVFWTNMYGLIIRKEHEMNMQNVEYILNISSMYITSEKFLEACLCHWGLPKLDSFHKFKENLKIFQLKSNWFQFTGWKSKS